MISHRVYRYMLSWVWDVCLLDRASFHVLSRPVPFKICSIFFRFAASRSVPGCIVPTTFTMYLLPSRPIPSRDICGILLYVKGTHYDMEEFDDDWAAGDVKYHLGTSMDRTYPDGRRLCS